MRFRDRLEAGRRLAEAVGALGVPDPVVLALPRGGVPVAFEVATALGAPLDVVVARKIGAPGQPEYGIGAVAEDGVVVATDAVRELGLGAAEFGRLAERAREELDRRVARYRAGRSLPPIAGRDVILVDDGLATGVTSEAALHALRRQQPRTLVLAVPVCAADTAVRLQRIADRVVCVHASHDFGAVGRWYEHFDQTSDDEVLDLLHRSRAGTP
jgi:putative phosphoribosyl transferase